MSWFNLEDVQREIDEEVQRTKSNPEFQRELEEINANSPQCPICHSKNLKKITIGNKIGSAALTGLFAIGHISKTYKCLNCGVEF